MHHSKAGWRKATPAQKTIPVVETVETTAEIAQRILNTLDNIRHQFRTGSDREQAMAMDLAIVTDELEILFKEEVIL